MITVIVALALLSLEGLTESRLSQDTSQVAYMLLLSPVRAIAVRAELLGTKESFLISTRECLEDFRKLSFRTKKAGSLPRLRVLSQFYAKEVLCGRRCAAAYVRHLEELNRQDFNRWDLVSIREARQVLYIYEMLADSIAYREYRPFEARVLLKRVMEALGDDFDVGKLPNPAPSWRKATR